MTAKKINVTSELPRCTQQKQNGREEEKIYRM